MPLDLIKVMAHDSLAAATDDATRASLVQLFIFGTDVDNPAVRAVIQPEFAPYRRPVDQPETYCMIRLGEAHLAERLGQKFDPRTDLTDLPGSQGSYLQRAVTLDFYSRSDDKAALQQAVDQFDAGTLLRPDFLDATLAAFSTLGLDTELDLAREAAHREIRRTVLEAWLFADHSAAQRAIGLAWALRDPDALPPAWIETLDRRDGADQLQREARLVEATLRGEWTQAASLAAVQLRDYPTH